jgi:hypothetical protein
VSPVTAGYGIDVAIVYFQCNLFRLQSMICDGWRQRPDWKCSCYNKSHLAVLRRVGVRFAKRRGSDQKQLRFLSVDEVPLMREGIATVINAKPDKRAISTKS